MTLCLHHVSARQHDYNPLSQLAYDVQILVKEIAFGFTNGCNDLLLNLLLFIELRKIKIESFSFGQQLIS